MAIFNSIIPGAAWAQTLTFPAGSIDFAGGETLRTRWRQNASSALVFDLTEGSGIVRNGNDYIIGLTSVETALLDGFSKISFDLYADKAGTRRAIGVRVHIPVRAGL